MNAKKLQCNCGICTFTRKVARIQEKLNERDRAVIEELLLKWEAAETETAYHRMRLNGTWR